MLHRQVGARSDSSLARGRELGVPFYARNRRSETLSLTSSRVESRGLDTRGILTTTVGRAVNDYIPRDVKGTTARASTRWSDFFTIFMNKRYNVVRVFRANITNWATLAHNRNKWEDYWLPLRTREAELDYSVTGEKIKQKRANGFKFLTNFCGRLKKRTLASLNSDVVIFFKNGPSVLRTK